MTTDKDCVNCGELRKLLNQQIKAFNELQDIRAKGCGKALNSIGKSNGEGYCGNHGLCSSCAKNHSPRTKSNSSENTPEKKYRGKDVSPPSGKCSKCGFPKIVHPWYERGITAEQVKGCEEFKRAKK